MKILSMILAVIMALSLTELLYAEAKTNISSGSTIAGTTAKSDALQHKPGMKAERGVKNILFGWTDIPKSIIQVTKDSKNPVWGLAAGAVKGIGKAVPRTVSGIVDVATFPLADYDKQLVKPDEWKTKIQ